MPESSIVGQTLVRAEVREVEKRPRDEKRGMLLNESHAHDRDIYL